LVEGDLQRALGANLRSQRLARDLSQEAFADLLGVHRTYIGAMERGERNLTLRSVERIAARLGVAALDLLAGPVAAAPSRKRPARAAREAAAAPRRRRAKTS
jgi:transcriptional regulator with XRE-family HTH domain